MQPCLLHHEKSERLPAQIAVLANDDFAWFARYGLAIQARNGLDDGTKQSKNLWYEETLPPDAVLAALIESRGGRWEAFTSASRFVTGLGRSHPVENGFACNAGHDQNDQCGRRDGSFRHRPSRWARQEWTNLPPVERAERERSRAARAELPGA